jgi:hypothetical protein
MAKIQGSDGLMGKRKIAILNIDSILNKFFLGQVRCQSACYKKFRMGLYVEFGWEMAVWEPKEKKSGWWRHLHLIRHFEVLKKKFFYEFFFYRTFLFIPKFQLICIQIDLAMENLCLAAILLFSAILFFFAPIYFFNFFLMISTFKIYHYIYSKLNSERNGFFLQLLSHYSGNVVE